MKQVNRLPEGGRIDRTRPLTFRFNGRTFQGYAGDTLASALLANGIRVVGRSFKYRRPRGIVGIGAEEPNAIVQVGAGAATIPALRATEVELYDGLVAATTRGWPGLNFDLLAVNEFFSPLFSAGFYYKTFMEPGFMWRWYEHGLRHASGLGISPRETDPDSYEHYNAHCDVLVAGGGPAGLMAALAAAKSGARVIIADEQGELGGSLLHDNATLNGNPAGLWPGKALAELRRCPEVITLPRSTVSGYYDHNFLTILERCRDHPDQPGTAGVRQRLWRVRAGRVVLAQGSHERPLVFPDNDRPGVMLASALSGYIRRYGVCPGSRAVLFTNNDGAYRSALDLLQAGADVAAIVDSRAHGAGAIAEPLREAGVELFQGCAVAGVSGRNGVRSVRVVPVSAGAVTGNGRTVHCDLLAMSGGWNPAVHLHSQAGGGIDWDETRACLVPGAARQDHVSVGACNGSFSLDACLEEGKQAGQDAARACGFEPVPFSTPGVGRETPGEARPLQPLWRVPLPQSCRRYPKQFIDYQNDTTVADVYQSVQEGYRNVEHVKRYTALGFGTDQGKMGNINGMAILAECLDKPVAEVGTTTFRPPYTAATFGACAGAAVGDLYDPVRKTALHDWHEAAGAEFEVVGQWLRPWYYPRAGEGIHDAVARECLAARRSLAIMDASTLGKIEVQGPDAVTFLERIYTHNVAGMKAGRCAYGIMLGEDGMVMDDGVMARLGDRHFYLTTTTGGAARVLGWLEQWLQTEWPDLNVYLSSVTERWSTIVLAGPASRKLLQGTETDIGFNREDIPFMTVRSGSLAGFPVRVFRVSFSGEMAFEINVESDLAPALWQQFMAAGEQYGITPYGTETMHVLRAEKGFVIVGQDTDGSVTPLDLGMNWMLSKDRDYLGRRSLARPDCQRPDRKQLVGLLIQDGGPENLPEGTQLVERPGATPPVPKLGHVTSSYQSACLGHPIALALVGAGRARKGDVIHAALRDGRHVPVKIVSPVFYDPNGERQHV